MDNADMPAMPTTPNTQNGVFQHDGLTKREHFAAMAMQGCRARHSEYKNWGDLVKDAVEMADALLAELNRTQRNKGEV